MGNVYFLFLFLSSLALNAQEITDSLLLHYRFDNNFDDSGINEFHGTNFGATFVEDRFGRTDSAVYFNGIDNYILFPNVEKLKPELPVSFSFWVKYEEVDYLYTSIFRTSYEEDVSSGVQFNSDVELNRYTISYGDGTHQYSPATRRTFLSSKSVDNESWHSVIAIVNGPTDMKLIIDCKDFNGSYVGSGNGLQYSDSPGVIGRGDRNNEPGDFFKGYLDDFMYWNRALQEIEYMDLCSKSIMNTDNVSFNEKILIYPNPVKDIMTIKSNQENEYYSIYNNIGQRVDFGKISDFKINVNNLAKGVYYLSLLDKEKRQTIRFIKE